ncbi:1,4-alpha-glucan branching protein [Streptomyces albus subsp. chlorinus]|uniref:maltokinase N-terminal cap-like domain-containing protein n=1 Tax=Streptomyces albus TaxID=1888 RepID=UPI00156E8CB2|nr:1,4-alpha-glucan branching protein [Streptomyces albus]NSC19806.1 1,4-alpha-glucan branching protein [Streptomyces albus subsp. chlorinus]
MAVIHHTVVKPTKLELLTSWLPSRPWYRGSADGPAPAKAGGFRLDDPEGEVGIEFIVVTDASGPDPTTYLVPLTYRGAALEGAEHALVGTMEHGVLGQRWIYDACYDPVAVAQLLALIAGRAQAQDQDSSDTPDREVTASLAGACPAHTEFTATEDQDSTMLTTPQGVTLRLHRVLRPEPAADGPLLAPRGATGHVAGAWKTPEGSRVRGLFAVLRPGKRD